MLGVQANSFDLVPPANPEKDQVPPDPPHHGQRVLPDVRAHAALHGFSGLFQRGIQLGMRCQSGKVSGQPLLVGRLY